MKEFIRKYQGRYSSFSVVIPVRNPGPELYATIDSVLSSDALPVEIIIVNDYSVSGGAIFSNVENKQYTQVVNNTFSPGISGALNVGLQTAVGEYVARIDSGDLVCADRFKKQIDILEKNDHCNLVASSMEVVDDYFSSMQYTINAKLYCAGVSVSPFARLPHPTWMFRKDSISACYDKRFTRCEDYGFLVQNFSVNEIVIVDEVLTLYQDDNANLSLKNELKASFWKLYIVLFLVNANFLTRVFVGGLYIVVRLGRLLVSRKKVI